MAIEYAGSSPPSMGPWFPDGLRPLALLLLEKCVQRLRLGGFVTHGIENLVTWALEDPWRQFPPWPAPPPVSTSFFTITLSGPNNKNRAPGNYDPGIPKGVAQDISSMKATHPDFSRAQYPSLDQKIHYWTDLSKRMETGGTTPWWQFQVPQDPQETIYDCDMELGTPLTTDCSQVVLNQLSTAAAASDTLSLTAGVTFFYANTCYIAISAAVALVLSWSQVRTAVTSLMRICLQHPHGPPHGGRAYVGTQPKQVNGRKRKRTEKRQDSAVAGSNVLPPHVNITMFEQREPWTNTINELKTCTWQAVAGGHPVSTCIKPKGP